MKPSQIRGIFIVFFGSIAYLLVDNHLIQTGSGLLCAIGMGDILKWIHYRNKRLTE